MTTTPILMASDHEPICGADKPAGNGNCFVCTRPAGHDGEHAAHVTPDIAPVHVWACEGAA